jgi:hypothetical protein
VPLDTTVFDPNLERRADGGKLTGRCEEARQSRWAMTHLAGKRAKQYVQLFSQQNRRSSK